MTWELWPRVTAFVLNCLKRCRFDLAVAIGNSRRRLDENWLLSVWVNIDDFNTEQNVIYVGLSKFLISLLSGFHT